MSIRFYCPQGHRLKVPDEKAGKAARCPVCQQRVTVPLESPTRAAQPQEGRSAEMYEGSAGSAAEELNPEPAVEIATAEPATARPSGPPQALVAPPVGSWAVAPPTAAYVLVQPPPREVSVMAAGMTSADSREASPPVDVPARRPHWAPFDANLPRKAFCRADQGQRQLVRWTALAMLLLACFQAAPAARFLNLLYAPDWAKWVIVLAALQLAFAAYLAILPSWPSLWVTMILLGGLASIYAAAMAIVAATPAGRPLLFELDDWRRTAAPWAACNVLLLGLLAYGCGRSATRWQRSWTIAYAHRND